MEDGFLKDFGMHCQKIYGDNQVFLIENVKIEELAVVDKNYNFTFSYVIGGFDGKDYYGTFDFNADNFKKLAKQMPQEMIEDFIDRVMNIGEYVKFKYPVKVNIITSLGKKVKLQTEEFIPFIIKDFPVDIDNVDIKDMVIIKNIF